MGKGDFRPAEDIAQKYRLSAFQVEELARRHHIIGGLRIEPDTGCQILVHRWSTEALIERLLSEVSS